MTTLIKKIQHRDTEDTEDTESMEVEVNRISENQKIESRESANIYPQVFLRNQNFIQSLKVFKKDYSTV